MASSRVKQLFPWESFPYRLELKDRIAWFMCQEHMDKEIARYKLKPKDYKKSCKRGYKIVKPDKPKKVKRRVVDKTRKDLLAPIVKSKNIEFDKKVKLLNPIINN